MRSILLLVLSASLISNVNAETDWNQWFRERTSEFENAQKMPEQERIPILGQMVRINAGYKRKPLDGVQLESYFRAQEALLKIPGHATYYKNRINESYTEFKEIALGKKTGEITGDVQREMMFGFRTLSQLPSPETVTVLGDMLSEEWSAPIPPGAEYYPPSLAIASVTPLAKLPFIDPATPPFESYDAEKNLASWQNWYTEVKSGTLSFAFLGQPVSYRFKPDGSIESTPRDASKDALPSPATKRVEKKPAAQVSSPSPSLKPWQRAGAVTAIIGLFAFMFYLLRKSRTKAV